MNILITGGASGLGKAITRVLAADASHTVYITYRKSEAKAKKLEAEFRNIISIHCDFEDSATVSALASKLAIFDLDVLIHNAYSGDYLKTHFHKIPINDFLTGFTNNILPVIEITQAAILNFRNKKRGKIITILTSALNETPPIGTSVYLANKAYLEKLTEVWAVENVKFNITSNALSPTFMLTDMTSGFDARVIDQIRESTPSKKLLTVEEVAEKVSFLVNSSVETNGENFVF